MSEYIDIKISFDQDTLRMIEELVQKYGMKKSPLIRMLIRERYRKEQRK